MVRSLVADRHGSGTTVFRQGYGMNTKTRNDLPCSRVPLAIQTVLFLLRDPSQLRDRFLGSWRRLRSNWIHAVFDAEGAPGIIDKHHGT